MIYIYIYILTYEHVFKISVDVMMQFPSDTTTFALLLPLAVALFTAHLNGTTSSRVGQNVVPGLNDG